VSHVQPESPASASAASPGDDPRVDALDEPTEIPLDDSADASADPEEESARAEEPPPPRVDPMTAYLRAQLDEKDVKLREYIDAYKTAKAEMAAARERLTRDRDKELDLARKRLAGDFLDVLDNLDRSLQGIQPGAPVESLAQGVGMVRAQFAGVLSGFGVEPIEALGQTFDSALHEAGGMIPAQPGQADQEVVWVERAGYTYKGQLLRAARVLIAKDG